MLLGDLLAEIEQASAAGSAVALLDDLVLVARVNEAAARQSMQAEAYIVAAVHRFEREANDADWTTLIGAATGSDNPGSACLRRMVMRALLEDEHEFQRGEPETGFDHQLRGSNVGKRGLADLIGSSIDDC